MSSILHRRRTIKSANLKAADAERTAPVEYTRAHEREPVPAHDRLSGRAQQEADAAAAADERARMEAEATGAAA